MSLLRPTLLVLGFFVLGATAVEAQRVPSSVWTRSDVRWDSRDDRDSDSDSDSDSDRRRNRSVWDRSPDRTATGTVIARATATRRLPATSCSAARVTATGRSTESMTTGGSLRQ